MPPVELRAAEQIKTYFRSDKWSLKSSTAGAQILHYFEYDDFPYLQFSLQTLVNYLSGNFLNHEADDVPVQEIFLRLPPKDWIIHYIGVRLNPSLEEFEIWENYNFTQLHFGAASSMETLMKS